VPNRRLGLELRRVSLILSAKEAFAIPASSHRSVVTELAEKFDVDAVAVTSSKARSLERGLSYHGRSGNGQDIASHVSARMTVSPS
jgi:hypothetical protein